MQEQMIAASEGKRHTLNEEIAEKRKGIEGLHMAGEGRVTDNTRSGAREAFKTLQHETDMTGAIDIGKSDTDSDDVGSWIERPAA